MKLERERTQWAAASGSPGSTELVRNEQTENWNSKARRFAALILEQHSQPFIAHNLTGDATEIAGRPDQPIVESTRTTDHETRQP